MQFLRRKWANELDYRLIKELWTCNQNRIASINDLPIKESGRKYHWPLGQRPDDHLGLSELGF